MNDNFPSAHVVEATTASKAPKAPMDIRTKLWVTDPPAMLSDEGETFIVVFTNRRNLMDYYRGGDLPIVGRNTPIQRRYGQFLRDSEHLNFTGLIIDPSHKINEVRTLKWVK